MRKSVEVLLTFIFLWIPMFSFAQEAKMDTIFHIVQPKETLYGLGRNYNVAFKNIVEANQITPPYEIKIGQKLIIPIEKKESSTTLATVVDSTKDHFMTPQDSFNYVTTEFDASLRQIAVTYQVEVDSLSKWNHIEADQIVNKGSAVIIGLGESDANPSEKDENQYKTVADFSEEEINSGEIPMLNVEKGKGEMVVLNNHHSSKSIALHKSETIGNYIKVTNPDNGVSVAVRVVGALPDEDLQKGIIIKLSQNACEKIGVINKEFGITIEYIN